MTVEETLYNGCVAAPMKPRFTTPTMLVIVVTCAAAISGCELPEYPYEPTDPDSNGTLGVMTRKPRAPVAAGSVAPFQIYGPRQRVARHHGDGFDVDGVLPPARIEQVSIEPVDTVPFAAVRVFYENGEGARHRSEWVPLESFEETLAEDPIVSNEFVLEAGSPGDVRLAIAGSVGHNDTRHAVEDVFEIAVKPVSHITVLPKFQWQKWTDELPLLLVGEEFELEYSGYSEESEALHGFDYFDAVVEPEGGLVLEEDTLDDILADELLFSALYPRRPRITATASQPGVVTITPRPAGSEVAFEFIEPKDITELSIEDLPPGESLHLEAREAGVDWEVVEFVAGVGDRSLVREHHAHLDYIAEVLSDDADSEACLLAAGYFQVDDPQSHLVLDDFDGRIGVTVVPQKPGRCEVRVTHLLPDGTTGASVTFSVEVE